eukprot:1289148-Pyramimonas_sp.AAC.1
MHWAMGRDCNSRRPGPSPRRGISPRHSEGPTSASTASLRPTPASASRTRARCCSEGCEPTGCSCSGRQSKASSRSSRAWR